MPADQEALLQQVRTAACVLSLRDGLVHGSPGHWMHAVHAAADVVASLHGLAWGALSELIPDLLRVHSDIDTIPLLVAIDVNAAPHPAGGFETWAGLQAQGFGVDVLETAQRRGEIVVASYREDGRVYVTLLGSSVRSEATLSAQQNRARMYQIQVTDLDIEAGLSNPLYADETIRAASLVDGRTHEDSHGYVVKWHGQHSPRGLDLPDGQTIGRIHQGIIEDPCGTVIGFYRRIHDRALEHSIVVILNGPAPSLEHSLEHSP